MQSVPMKKLLYILSFFILAFSLEGCGSHKVDEHAKAMEYKEQYIQILRSTGRPGMEEVIRQLEATDFFTMEAGNHHKIEGGLVKHSLEVYRIMRCFAWFQSSDSIAIVALFHDMGKYDLGGWHTWRSVFHLTEWGLKLTAEEYIAIFRHHNLEFKYYRHPLHRALVVADTISTGWWLLWH